MNSRSCVVCGSSLVAAHWNATTCSEACKVERRRRYSSRYQNEKREQSRAYWRKYAAKPQVKERKLRHARQRRKADPIKARERDREKRLKNIERIRQYDRQWKAFWRAENTDLSRQKQRQWWHRMAASLLAMQEVTGEPPSKRRIGARRNGPAKPLPKPEVASHRLQSRQCRCCGADISERPKRVKVCSVECRREDNRRRATEYRWKNIDLCREKDRLRSGAKPIGVRRKYQAAWRERNRESLKEKDRSRYLEKRDLQLDQQHARYVQMRASFLALKEINPEIINETRTPA